MNPVTRRTAVKTASNAVASLAAASAVPALASLNFASPAIQKSSASERVRIGVIGVGSQGKGHVSRYVGLPNVEVAYLCDPDEKRLAEASKIANSATLVGDLRRVLDDPTIDAVSIATPDHWHAPAAILACEAGKHVYVEKPCCHNFREGELLVAAARKHRRIVQHGTQSRSNPLIANAVQMLREGIIGEVLVAKAWNVQRRNNIGRGKPSEVPAGFDYDMWIGPAPMVPFQSNRHHYSWHWWYDFGTGDFGNDGVHELDYARWGLGVESLPNRISALGGKYFFDDDQQFPDTQMAIFEFDGDGSFGSKRQLIFEMRIWSRSFPYNVDNGTEFYGTKGRMMLTKRGKLEVFDDQNKLIVDPKPRNPVQLETDSHQLDFVQAIRTGRKPNAEIEIGFQSSALCNLGNVSTRLGRTLQLDPLKRQIVNDQEANELLGRKYRSGGHWAIPKGA